MSPNNPLTDSTLMHRQGPHSNLHPSLPTTCFNDTITTPLATWIYLFLLLVTFIPFALLAHFRSRSSVPKSAFFSPDSQEAPLPSSTPRWAVITLRVLYAFFILAAIAMVSLEIARMNVAQLGLGLLPFEYPGIVIAAAVHLGLVLARNKRRDGRGKGGRATLMVERLGWGLNTLYWVMTAVVWAIKIATYSLEGLHSRDGMSPEDAYLVVDEVTDLGVMVFLAVVLIIFEALGMAGIA